jgi:uncharacterized protein VirK/YbjX
MLRNLGGESAAALFGRSVLLWQKDGDAFSPNLSIHLEPNGRCKREGELQFRFSSTDDLCWLIFTFAPGEIFDSAAPTILFIGSLQGRPHSQNQQQMASQANNGIAPATMLFLAAQAMAKLVGAAEIIAVDGTDHVNDFSDPMKYRDRWMKWGGTPHGRFYRLWVERLPKPLSEVRTHRSRARKRRIAKQLIGQSLEQGFAQLLR